MIVFSRRPAFEVRGRENGLLLSLGRTGTPKTHKKTSVEGGLLQNQIKSERRNYVVPHITTKRSGGAGEFVGKYVAPGVATAQRQKAEPSTPCEVKSPPPTVEFKRGMSDWDWSRWHNSIPPNSRLISFVLANFSELLQGCSCEWGIDPLEGHLRHFTRS